MLHRCNRCDQIQHDLVHVPTSFGDNGWNGLVGRAGFAETLESYRYVVKNALYKSLFILEVREIKNGLFLVLERERYLFSKCLTMMMMTTG